MSLSAARMPVATHDGEPTVMFPDRQAAKDSAGPTGPVQAISKTDDGFRLWEGDCDPVGWIVSVRPAGGYWCDFESTSAAQDFWELALMTARSRGALLSAARAAADGGSDAHAALQQAQRWSSVVDTLRNELDATTPSPRF